MRSGKFVPAPALTRVLVPAEALKAMEKVASHINEMQKIYEDYGAVFDQLVAEQIGHDKEVRSPPRHAFQPVCAGSMAPTAPSKCGARATFYS